MKNENILIAKAAALRIQIDITYKLFDNLKQECREIRRTLKTFKEVQGTNADIFPSMTQTIIEQLEELRADKWNEVRGTRLALTHVEEEYYKTMREIDELENENV